MNSFWRVIRNTWRLDKMVWKELWWVLIAMASSFVVLAFFPFVISYLNANLIDLLVKQVGSKEISGSIWLLLASIFAVSFFQMLLSTASNYLERAQYLQTDWIFNATISEKKVELDVAFYEDAQNNNLIRRILDDFAWRIKNMIWRQFSLIASIVELIVAALILGSNVWWLVPILFVVNLPIFFVESKFSDTVWHISASQSESKRYYFAYNANFESIVRIIETKLFGYTKYFLDLMSKINSDFIEASLESQKKRIYFTGMAVFLSELVNLGMLGFFVWQVLQGQISLGFMVLLLAVMARFKDSLIAFFQHWARQAEDNSYADDFFAFMEAKPVIKSLPEASKLYLKKAPLIEFENVSFSYPGTDKLILENLNFKINSGEKIALVGINGAGKTTLIKLLCRFYDPTKGRILINGVDLREINLNDWYSSLGVLFQEYAHHNLPVKEAIAVGRVQEEFDLNKVYSSAQKSDASDFIGGWKNGYEQILGKGFEDGVEPSVGQWQKLAIARVLYREPWIYVLDEPTASIDAEAEMKIFEKLESISDQNTVILISHRFSTVRKADKIGVIENGRLSEFGTHEQLLENKATYARLFKMQAKGYL